MEIYSSGEIVGILDRSYETDGAFITFDDVLVKGNLWGELEYRGVRMRVRHVRTIIGFEVTLRGGRGPVWKGVQCEIIREEG